MLRYLVEEGLMELHRGALRRVSEESLAGRIPEGLRDVIGKRLSRLTDKTNQMLSVASVIGREFRLDVLQRVAGLTQEELETGLAEAMAVAVVEERAALGTVTYRFTHAFFRQTLYEETIAPRRIRLHQQVARALEAVYGRRLEEHAAELAEHYAYSSDPADLAKAVHYGELAAQRALSVYAYGEAVRHLEQALKVQEVLDLDDNAKRCDLLLALGEALLPAGEPLRVTETLAPEALALAEALGDSVRASRACQQALQSLYRQSGGPVALGSGRYRQWAEKADRHAAPRSLDRVYADLALGGIAVGTEPWAAWNLLQRALGLARELDDNEALYRCAGLIIAGAWPPRYQAERLRTAEEFAVRRREGVSSSTLGTLRVFSFRPFLAWGKRDEAEAALHEAKVIAERTRDNSLLIRCLAQESVVAAIDGRLEEAVEIGERLHVRAEELGVPGIGAAQEYVVTFWPLLHLGRTAEWLSTRPDEVRAAFGEGRGLGVVVAHCLADLSRWEEFRELLVRLRQRRQAAGDAFDLPVASLTSLLAAAVLSQDRELAAQFRERLHPVAVMIGDQHWTCPARHLGDASALLGDREQARRYYDQALEVAGKVRFRPEIALTHLQLAELLLEEAGQAAAGSVGARHAVPAPSAAQRNEALQHLDFAIAEFREMKMQPALERALRHKEVLKA